MFDFKYCYYLSFDTALNIDKPSIAIVVTNLTIYLKIGFSYKANENCPTNWKEWIINKSKLRILAPDKYFHGFAFVTNNLSKSTNSPRQLNSCSNTLHFNMKCFLGTHAKFPESAPPAMLVYVLVMSRRHKIFATFKLISKNLDDSLAGFFCFSSNQR